MAKKNSKKREYTAEELANRAEYKNMTIEDIIEYCKANGEVAWLKEAAKKKVPVKRYPKVKTTNDNGKKVMVSDKTQEPSIEMELISFVQLKREFCKKFKPHLVPEKAEKGKTMYELIADL